jgi:CRISPR-associated endonuclease Cas1
MAATATVSQLFQPRNSLTPRHGVVTLYGYGITVQVDRGHLILKDGIGRDRRETRYPRVGHGLRRLVVIGSDGFVSFAALRWLADQDAAFVMLERDGSVLTTTGPVRPSDARLRRAQALAHQSGAALTISRELIGQKLAAQEQLARDVLQDAPIAKLIASARVALAKAETIGGIRVLESQAAHAYWSLWRTVPVMFPANDLKRMPDHWRTFGTRVSPLTGSPRLAVNPANAILNYLYAILESEARLAAATLGLDPGLGVMHFDSRTRDSLASDLMEPIRPQADRYLLDWITRTPFRREWFFEQRDGSCRLMGTFAQRLSETAATWARAVAPVAEWVARSLWTTRSSISSDPSPATRLTSQRKRERRGGSPIPQLAPPKPPRVCRLCGEATAKESRYCQPCGIRFSTQCLVKGAEQGRMAAQSYGAQVRRAKTQLNHAAQRRAWTDAGASTIDSQTFREEVQPKLGKVTLAAIVSALGVSVSYASDIRTGRRVPHPRHWLTLARLVEV